MALYLHGALQCLVQCPNTEGIIIKLIRAIVLKSYTHKKDMSHLVDYITVYMIN